MTTRQRQAYGLALHVVHLARVEGKSATAATKEAGTSLKTVLRYARPAFRRVKRRWVVRPKDRLPRPMRFYDERDETVITVGGSEDASRVAEYHNAIRLRAETGDASAVRKFRGKTITDVDGKRHPFITDPQILNRLARAGVLSGFEEIYSLSS